MVKNKYYQCEICNFNYKDKKWSDKCGDWCDNYKSCNLEITKHAVKNVK